MSNVSYEKSNARYITDKITFSKSEVRFNELVKQTRIIIDSNFRLDKSIDKDVSLPTGLTDVPSVHDPINPVRDASTSQTDATAHPPHSVIKKSSSPTTPKASLPLIQTKSGTAPHSTPLPDNPRLPSGTQTLPTTTELSSSVITGSKDKPPTSPSISSVIIDAPVPSSTIGNSIKSIAMQIKTETSLIFVGNTVSSFDAPNIDNVYGDDDDGVLVRLFLKFNSTMETTRKKCFLRAIFRGCVLLKIHVFDVFFLI